MTNPETSNQLVRQMHENIADDENASKELLREIQRVHYSELNDAGTVGRFIDAVLSAEFNDPNAIPVAGRSIKGEVTHLFLALNNPNGQRIVRDVAEVFDGVSMPVNNFHEEDVAIVKRQIDGLDTMVAAGMITLSPDLSQAQDLTSLIKDGF